MIFKLIFYLNKLTSFFKMYSKIKLYNTNDMTNIIINDKINDLIKK